MRGEFERGPFEYFIVDVDAVEMLWRIGGLDSLSCSVDLDRKVERVILDAVVHCSEYSDGSPIKCKGCGDWCCGIGGAPPYEPVSGVYIEGFVECPGLTRRCPFSSVVDIDMDACRAILGVDEVYLVCKECKSEAKERKMGEKTVKEGCKDHLGVSTSL